MAKFCGKIGFVTTEETKPGVWKEKVVERTYYGDIVRSYRNLESYEKVNSDINVNNQISIVADPYINNNIFAMRYAEFMGAKWTIKNAEVQYPRIILYLGGLYNVQK